MASGPRLSEDQSRLLEEALAVVRQQSLMMRRCLETPGKLMDALKCASTLISELRTPSLPPKQYYELYMAVFDALRHLSDYLRESHPVNHLADLYELVQYAGNIIPRLYLMITVGTVYMAISDAPVKEIMKDMMEMSRGVQHPVRGLFLRYYLSGQARDHLPTDTGEGPQGNLQDSINFILTNFVEMNKLWVRLQHQGHSREREQRTQERRELEVLVGSNLVRLSQLVDLETYKSVILQPLLEQVVQCRDVLAQEYLLEVITKAFPDEYHLHTLDMLLTAISKLNPHVDMKKIVIGLMDRLSSYASRDSDSKDTIEAKREAEEDATRKLLERVKISEEPGPTEAPETKQNGTAEPAKESKMEKSEQESLPGVSVEAPKEDTGAESKSALPGDIKLYEVFYDQVVNLVKTRGLPIQDTIALLVSLANLALNIYPNKLEYVDQILEFATQKTLEHADSADLHSAPAQSSLLNLLLAPIHSYASIFTALSLPNYIPLYAAQSYPTRRAVAGDISRNILRSKTLISTTENLDNVLRVLKVLIKEGMQQPLGYPGMSTQRRGETDETIEEQGWLARIVHFIQGSNNDIQFKLLQATRTAYLEGNERIRYTTPAIITASLKLARHLKKREHFEDNFQSQSTALFRFMHQCVSTLYQRVNSGCAELSLRLFVLCGQVADEVGFEEFSYELFAQAFTVYEDSISDSRAQFQAVCILVSALYGTRNFSRENYDTLITKAALHGSKLLKKPDQCRAVYLASHLWWVMDSPQPEGEEPKVVYRDGKRVLECLQRALRVADACMDTAVSVELFIEILNRYVYYFDQQNESVTIKYLNGLIELIQSNLQSNQVDGSINSSLENPKRHFQRTLEYIKSREYEGVVTEPSV
ncbi:Vacuolar protein sorting-associated protein 35 containing protein [Coccidioides posadasii C735 delta SOWgp]|uniref:Vacuolar protein sorting-associated protein 35 n=1 Tax=Coccidioides posadasii (strain C735) TaxID=222929 RepID=C5P9T9_COCP7|nr:Vacuolar protein sorting-associated protein 35 containing protein [Coccidioides posadasii C735 delta SOWgp]EER26501.1 Vacuolar protein sorting-associated protein 35 containing protein [Coccidioides posadasii C735 delta SOWgp]|eukprot:XP_003068646.1 Vacuolar protein sorting-associated protein 35 containing protein [Coccidioides posadasii C735 delta SOWgp]